MLPMIYEYFGCFYPWPKKEIGVPGSEPGVAPQALLLPFHPYPEIMFGVYNITYFPSFYISEALKQQL